MQEATFTVEEVTPFRFMVRLQGSLQDATIVALRDDLLPRLRKVGSKGEVIIDFIGAESCSTAARMELIEQQRAIAACRCRTAFVADRPRFRGIGLFVAHTSDDPNARAFHMLHQAQAWLSSKDGRVESITNYIRHNARKSRRWIRKLSSGESIRRAAGGGRRSSHDSQDGEGER